MARLSSESSEKPSSTLFTQEFSLADRVALVTGANQGLGLESVLALAEAGARAVYCVDIAEEPSPDWLKARDFLSRMYGEGGPGRLEYVRRNVSDQERMLELGKTIGDKEGRVDVCLAAAGILGQPTYSLDVSETELQRVLDINLKGAFYTAQAAGQQMARFGNGGSIVLIASTAGHVALPDMKILPYALSKSGVLQMARTLAGELSPQGIRVNSISPGFFKTQMAAPYADASFAGVNILERIGEPGEFRGTLVWLASDASSYCTGANIELSGGHTVL